MGLNASNGYYCHFGKIFAVYVVSLLVALLISCALADDPPKLSIQPRDQHVKAGRLAAFYCASYGDPNPTIHWRKNGKRLSSNQSRYQLMNFTGGLSMLRIELVRAGRDNATFECVAENGVGDAVSGEAMLTVYDEKNPEPRGYPTITTHPSTKVVEMGHDVILMCTADGDPKPQIIWLRDMQPIDTKSNERYEILEKEYPGSLKIRDSVENDQGKYECVAENSVGTEYSHSTNLYVKVRRVAPQFTIVPPPVMEVKVGQDFNINCVAVGSPMPFVKWLKEPTTEITMEDKLPVGKNVLEITNAQTSANYTCVAASALGRINATTLVKVQSLPGPPIDLKVSDVSASSVRLSWSHPTANEVQYYVILYKPRHTNQLFSEISGVITMYYTVRALSPYTEYEFYVAGVNNLGRGAPSSTVVIITGETAPGTAPRNVQVRPLSSSTMVIQWDEPETPNGQVRAYKVYYTMEPDTPMQSWSSQLVDSNSLTTISGLTPLTMYTIRVQALTSVGSGPLSPPVQIKTQQGVPSQPRDLRATDVTESTITLEWSKPAHSGEVILGYDLMWNDTFSKDKNHRRIPVTEKYTLTELYPNTLYYVWLSARSHRGEGATTSPIPIRTKQFVPGAPPQNVTAEAVGPTSVLLKWSPPPENMTNGMITYYRVYVVEANNSDSAANMITVSNISYLMLDELKRWTTYRFWILAGTAVGDGPPSAPITVTTQEDVPGPPTEVKATPINSTTLFVEWQPPAENERNGLIRRYHVHVQETREGASLFNEPLKFDAEGAMEYNVTGLQPDTLYIVQVAALTIKGDGARSTQVTVRTPGGVPIRPTINTKLIEKDGNLTLDLEWTKPTQTYGELMGYKLKYGIKDNVLIEIDLNPKMTQYRLDSLERGVEYEFRVSGKNHIGYGQEALAYLKTTEGPPTGSPANITHRFQTPDIVCINWLQPIREQRNGQIIRYDVEFSKKIDQSEVDRRNTTKNKIVFSGLEVGVEYMYRVCAATSKGAGPWSQTITFTTNKDMIRAPLGLNAMATSDQSIEIWWLSTPSSANLLGYQLFYTMSPVDDLDEWDRKTIGLTESAQLVSLQKNAEYTIAVAANTSSGLGRLSEKKPVKVKPEDVPLNFRAKEVTTHSITLMWSRPIKLNPINYKVTYDSFKEFVDSQGVTQSQSLPKRTVVLGPTEETYHLSKLSPFTTYNINISAIASDGHYRPPNRITVTTYMAAPLPMVKPDFYGVMSDKEIQVILPQASEEYGLINHYYLIVVPVTPETANMNPDSFVTNDLEAITETIDDTKAYIAARFPHRNIPYTFVLGSGENNDGFVNKKLVKGVGYKIFVRAVVDAQKNLYTSSAFSESFSLEMRSTPNGG